MADRTSLAGLLILAVISASAASVNAQHPGNIRGVVTNAITGAPLADAEITVVGSELATTSNIQGFYLISGVPPGLVKVMAQLIGYLPITTAYYSIRPDSTVSVDFRLAPVTVELDPLEVTGQRAERPGYVVGARVVTAEQLPKRGNILDALGSVVAGLRTTGRYEDTRTRSRGSFNDVLFVVDGVTVTPPLHFYIDAADVECVEVRHGAHAASEFRRNMIGQTYSGVILIWTRGGNAPMPRSCFERQPGSP